MKSKKRRVSLVVLGLCALAGGLVGLRSLRQGSPPDVEANGRNASVARVDAKNAANTEAFRKNRPAEGRVGQRMLYKATFQAETRDISDSAPKDTTITSAKLSLSVVAEGENGIELAAVLSDVSVVSDTEKTYDGFEKALCDSLKTPFVIVTAPTGKVLSIAFPPEINQLGAGILRGIAATLQFTRPVEAKPLPRSWRVDESDNLGTYQAAYAATGAGQYRKSVDVYSGLALNAFFSMAKKTNKSTASLVGDYQLEADGLLRVASMKQMVSLPGATDGATVISATYRLELTGLERGGMRVAGSDAWPREALANVVKRKLGAPSERENRKLLGDATWGSLTDEMRTAIGKGDDDARLKVAGRMSALFALEPERARDAALAMRRVQNQKEAQTVLGALADTHNQQALSALQEVAVDPSCNQNVREHALGHLGLHDEPNGETLKTLSREATEETDPILKEQAVLSLGSVAGKLQSSTEDSAAATQVIADLQTDLANTKEPQMQAVYLKALGNAGGTGVLAAVAAKLGDPDLRVRQSALFSLRFIPGDEADGLVVKALLTDVEPVIRATAAQTAGFRVPTNTLLGAMSQSVKGDQEAGVRGSVISSLSLFLAKAPVETRALLEWVSTNAPTAAEREDAQRILQLVA